MIGPCIEHHRPQALAKVSGLPIVTALEALLTGLAIAAVTSTIMTTAQVSTTASTSTRTLAASKNNLSGAAIAGAVVGPICGVALLLGLAFLCLRRRRNDPLKEKESANAHPLTPNLRNPPFGYVAYKPAVYDPELSPANITNPYRPRSVPPVYPGTEQPGPSMLVKEMQTLTMPLGNDSATPSSLSLERQVGVQTPRRMYNSAVLARSSTTAEFGTDDRAAMPSELPTATGLFVEPVA